MCAASRSKPFAVFLVYNIFYAWYVHIDFNSRYVSTTVLLANCISDITTHLNTPDWHYIASNPLVLCSLHLSHQLHTLYQGG
jgi:hypothetical protein